MNVLYIIGNGFDIAQGMKTSYPDFYKTLNNKVYDASYWMQQVVKDINTDIKLWSDMEEALGAFTSKVTSVEDFEDLYFRLSDHLQEYLKNEEANFLPTKELCNKCRKDVATLSSYLGETDKISYQSFRNERSSGEDITIITLNYTNTIEKLLSFNNTTILDLGNGKYLRQIIHVHGMLDDTIIIGVNNEEQIANKDFCTNDDVKDLLIKSQANITMKYDRHLLCEKRVREANLIILYGVSLGETDAYWWHLIGEQLKNRKSLAIIQFLYKPKEIIPTRKQILGRIERKQSECLMRKFGLTKEEWYGNSISDRVFFITNSNAFKL